MPNKPYFSGAAQYCPYRKPEAIGEYILWRDNNTGTVAIWFLNSSGYIQSTASVGAVPIATTWTIAETGDFDGNGKSDILWIDGTGNVAIWFMNGATIASTTGLGNVGTSWTVQATNAE